MNIVQKLIEADRKQSKKIAIVGDAMQDTYIHGHFGTCQEECYKFVEERHVTVMGGAGNSWRQLENWNAVTKQYGPIGAIKTRYLVNCKYVFRHDHDFASDTDWSRQRDKDWFDLVGFTPDAILLSDYDKGYLSEEYIRVLIDYAKERCIPIVADAKREPGLYEGAIIKCNESYAEKFDIAHKTNIEFVWTNGSESPYISTNRTKDYWHLWNICTKKHSVICVNHVGAGDSFAAHLTLSLAHGFPLDDAAAIAHSAGRVYVQHEHNRAPYPHEIARDYDPVMGKVVRGDMTALRQSNPGRIVFTNGVFRVPHAGHAWLMQWAKQQGDTLVVGVNSDESAARIRPGMFVMPLEERLRILASMDAVDWIVVFDDDPCEVMRKIKPNFLVKGAEYKHSQVPGSDLAKLCIAPEGPFPGRHATSLTNDIKADCR